MDGRTISGAPPPPQSLTGNRSLPPRSGAVVTDSSGPLDGGSTAVRRFGGSCESERRLVPVGYAAEQTQLVVHGGEMDGNRTEDSGGVRAIRRNYPEYIRCTNDASVTGHGFAEVGGDQSAMTHLPRVS